MVAEERATPSGQDAGQHSERGRETEGRESVVKSETGTQHQDTQMRKKKQNRKRARDKRKKKYNQR